MNIYILIIIGVCIVFIIAYYLILARKVGYKTIITKSVFFYGTVGLFLIIAYTLIQLSSLQLAFHFFSLVLTIFGIQCWARIISIYPKYKKQAGTLILDLGQHPLILKMSLIICASFFMWEGFSSIFIKSVSSSLLGYYDNKLFFYSSGFLFVSIAATCFLISISKREIKENGILFFPNLIKWEKIISYQWVGRRKNCLKLQVRNSIPFNGQVTILISPVQKEEVDNILNAHVSRG